MKYLVVMLLSCALLGGCESNQSQEDIRNPDMQEQVTQAPSVYKYYINSNLSVEDNLTKNVALATVEMPVNDPIVVDDVYNVMVLIDVKSEISEVGKISFDLDKLDKVDYDVDQYIENYREEGVVLTTNNQQEVIALLCHESEGIPTTAIWYQDMDGEFEVFVLAYNGLEPTEGLVK